MNAGKFIENFFDAIFNNLPAKRRLSFEDITKMFSDDVDKIILQNEREGKQFFSGKLLIREMKEENFRVSFEMYFIIPDEEDCEVVKSEGGLIPMSRLKSEAILQLKANKELVFEITAPQTV